MIGYLDTSALVPLLVSESSSAACGRFWDDADDVVTSRTLFVESAAALAQARRLRRLTDAGHRRALALLDELWQELDVVDVDDQLVRRSADLARRFALRGYDAVHCASAERLADVDLVAAAGDRQLLSAWSRLGLATYDVNDAGS